MAEAPALALVADVFIQIIIMIMVIFKWLSLKAKSEIFKRLSLKAKLAFPSASFLVPNGQR